MTTSSSELRAAAARLATLHAARHPLGLAPAAGDTLVAALDAGATPADALARAGAPARVVEAIREATPPDLAGVLGDVASALGRAVARRRAVQGQALYPALLAVAAFVAASVALGGVGPALAFVRAGDGPAVAAGRTAAVVALGIALGLLAVLGTALAREAPAFPFTRARREHERALVLSVAAGLARRGSPLPVALRAAARLSADRGLGDDARELAAALDRGDAGATGVRLLGPLGAGILAAAATEGQGPAALGAIADLAEATAESGLPALLLRAEVAALALGGLAIGAACAAFMLAYAGSYGGIAW